MAADFNAGSIEGTLDLDASPFKRGLDWAKAEAKKFEDTHISPHLGLDTKDFTVERAKANLELDKLGAKRVGPKVELASVDPLLAKLGLVTAATDAASGSKTGMGILGMIAKFGSLGVGAISLVAALDPATAAVVAFALAAGTAFGGLVIGLGLFGAAAKGAFDVLTAANAAGKTLTGWAGKAQKALKSLTGGWDALQKTVRPEMFKLLTVAFSGLAGILPKLAPLLGTTTRGMTSVVQSVLAVARTPLFSKFLKQLQSFMGGFLTGLGPTLARALKTFMHLFGALRPLMTDLGHGITKASKAAEKFSAGPGLKKFLGHVQKFLPLLGKLVKDVFKTLGKIGKELAPLSRPALKFIDALVKGLGQVNLKPLAKAIGPILDKMSGALPTVAKVLSKVVAGLAAILRNKAAVKIIAGVVALMVAQKVIGFGGALIEAAKASKILAGAQKLLNLVLEANPWVKLALVVIAIGAALIYAYKHSTTFRHIVQGAFNDVKNVVEAVVGWFKHDFIPFFTKTIPGAFQAVVSWVKQHWPLILSILTGPIGAAVIFIAHHWDQIKDAFESALHWVERVFVGAWNKIEDWIINPVESAWHKLTSVLSSIKNGFKDAVNAVGGFFAGLPGKLEGPIKDALSWLGDHFAKPINSLLSKVGLHISLPTFGDGGQVPGYAGGGLLTGAWKGPKADNILIRANPREFIEPVAAVDHYGPGLFEALRQRKIPKAAIPRFGLGGLIGGAEHLAGSAWGGMKHAATKVITAVNPAHIFEAMANKLLGGFSSDIWGSAVGAAAKKTVSALANKVKDFVSSMFGGGGSKGAPSGAYTGTSGVGQWAGMASRVLSMLGQSQAWLPTLLHRMNVESGGNPRAINNWDSNAAAGHPSKGLMQTIDGTFDAYAGPYRGLGIWNPLANTYAGVNYALHRYGVPAVGGTAGYAAGTMAATPGFHTVGERGPELLHFKGGEQVLPHPGSGTSDLAAQTMIQLLQAILSKTPSGDDLGNISDAKIRQLIQIARAA